MFGGLFKYWSLFRKTVRGVDSSRQLALGITFGMFVGVLPKDSLLTYGFGTLMLLTTANLLCGGIAGFAFSWIGSILDPFAHQIGQRVLTYEPLAETWAWLYQIPLMPWTRFENTVVMGSLVIALAAAIPVYLISRMFFECYGESAKRALTKSHFVNWLIGSPARPESEAQIS